MTKNLPMEIVLIFALLITVAHGVDFDPESNNWIQGEYGSFSCSNSVAVIVTKNGSEEASCTTDGTNVCPKPAPSYAKVTVTGNTLNFTILKLDRARDTATWECSGTSTFIDVKIPVPSVTIINKNSLIFTDGQPTSITCKTGVSYPYATFTWSIGGTTITGTTTTNNPDGTTTSILQYNAKKTDHNKILQCSATNGYGSTKSDSITLLIRFPVPSVTIVNKNSLIFTGGQTTSITCKTGVSNPPANIIWSIDGTTITGATTTNNSDGTTTSILQYNAKKADRDKKLKCSATNSYGSPQTDNLTILIRSSPELKKNPNINQCLHVEVTVFAYPPPTCKWLFNGKDPEEKFIIVSDSNQHTCKISSISDVRNIPHGDYYVNISNELGFISHNINIPEIRDLYPIYLLIVQVLRIVVIILLIIIIIVRTEEGTNVTTIVSIVTGVIIVACVIILIYVLVHIKEVFWIIVSCLMVVFSILTAILIPIIHLLLTKKVEGKSVKSVFRGLMVLSAVVIIFSLALLIYISVILVQYEVCDKDNLTGGVCLQAGDLIFTIGLTVLVYKKYKKLEPSSTRTVTPNSKTHPTTKQKTPQIQNTTNTVGKGKQGVGTGKQGVGTGKQGGQEGKRGQEGMTAKQEGVEGKKDKKEGKEEKGVTELKEGQEGKKVKKKKSRKKENEKTGDTRVNENNDMLDSKNKNQSFRPLPHPQTNLTNLPPVKGQILK